MENKTKAHLAALGANLIFGANYSIVKNITPSVIEPFGLNVVRVLVALVMFWSLYFIEPSPAHVEKSDIRRLIICAATGIAINQMLFVKGLSLTTSIHASLIGLCTPVFITIIAAWLLRERLTKLKIAGLLAGITGAMLLIAGKESTGAGNDILSGDTFILINSISYGFFLVLSRPLMKRYEPLHVLRWIFTIGTFMIVPLGWNQFIKVDWSSLNTSQWACIAFVTIGSTFTTYLFNIYSLKHISNTANGSYIYTQPVFAGLIAIIFMGEALTLAKIIAAVLISTGVYLVNRKTDTT